MKIKRLDDKPMVIHTKKKIRLHNCEPKKGIINKYRTAIDDSKKSIKTKKSCIGVTDILDAAATNAQTDGGDEVKDAILIEKMAIQPLTKASTKASSKGREQFKKQSLMKSRKKLKKVNIAKNIGKKSSKYFKNKAGKYTSKKVTKNSSRTIANTVEKIAISSFTVNDAEAETKSGLSYTGVATGRAVRDIAGVKTKANSRTRKIKVFLDKMKKQNKHQDSFGNIVKDLFLNKLAMPTKKVAVAVGAFFLLLVILIAVTVLPVVGLISILYNSPFAFFLPPLEDGDTVTTVCSDYVADFNREVQDLVNTHTGCDTGKIVYVGYEDEQPSNYNDIIAVYMVKYGVEDTATIMNDTTMENLKGVVDDMCSYTTSTGSETTVNPDGTTITQTVFYINVTLKTYADMVTEYEFDADRSEMVEQIMQMFEST